MDSPLSLSLPLSVYRANSPQPSSSQNLVHQVFQQLTDGRMLVLRQAGKFAGGEILHGLGYGLDPRNNHRDFWGIEDEAQRCLRQRALGGGQEATFFSQSCLQSQI